MSVTHALPSPFAIYYQAVQCCVCGCYFAMDVRFYKEKKENRTEFFCPVGHEQHFTAEREVDRLKKQNEELQRRADWHRQLAERRSKTISSLKGQQTKLKNRIKNGVCPCCNRSFTNLHQHMQKQHPDFVKEQKK